MSDKNLIEEFKKLKIEKLNNINNAIDKLNEAKNVKVFYGKSKNNKKKRKRDENYDSALWLTGC